MANQYQLSTIRPARQGGEPVRLAVDEYWCESLEKAQAFFQAKYPAFMSADTAEVKMIYDGADAADKAKAAENLAKETGLPVFYDRFGGISLSRGNLTRTGLAPTVDAVHDAWNKMGANFWNAPDTSRGSTGGSWWNEEN